MTLALWALALLAVVRAADLDRPHPQKRVRKRTAWPGAEPAGDPAPPVASGTAGAARGAAGAGLVALAPPATSTSQLTTVVLVHQGFVQKVRYVGLPNRGGFGWNPQSQAHELSIASGEHDLRAYSLRSSTVIWIGLFAAKRRYR